MIKSKNLFLIALFIITAFISTSESLTKLCASDLHYLSML